MFKHIIDENLELRLRSIQDVEEFYLLVDRNREYLREWLPWVDGVKSSKDIKDSTLRSLDQFSNNDGFQAGIWYKGKIVGIIGLHKINWNHRHTSIGYWLAEEYQGKGIMTKCCKAAINYIFNDLKLERVEIRCAEQNLKSKAIPERLGFTKEGISRNVENLYGEFVNHDIYGILKDEWINTP